MIEDLYAEMKKYKAIGDRALEQIPDADLNWIPCADGNSAAMIVRHLSGNFASRFTEFLTSDGEKPWRARDEEFADRQYTRAEMLEMWERGWDVVAREVGPLTDANAVQTVTIRQLPLTVHQALVRSLAHAAYHVGQIVIVARARADAWRWISIPKGQSEQYNKAPTLEKGPR